MTKGLVLLLLVVPRDPIWLISGSGKRSISPYLLHLFILYIISKALVAPGSMEWVRTQNDKYDVLRLGGIIVLSFGLNLVLSSTPVWAVVSGIFQPTWLERVCSSVLREVLDESKSSQRKSADDPYLQTSKQEPYCDPAPQAQMAHVECQDAELGHEQPVLLKHLTSSQCVKVSDAGGSDEKSISI